MRWLYAFLVKNTARIFTISKKKQAETLLLIFFTKRQQKILILGVQCHSFRFFISQIGTETSTYYIQ
jgi:hypothetical protein